MSRRRSQLRGWVFFQLDLCQSLRSSKTQQVLYLNRRRKIAIQIWRRLQPQVNHRWRQRPANPPLRHQQTSPSRIVVPAQNHTVTLPWSVAHSFDPFFFKFYSQLRDRSWRQIHGSFRNWGEPTWNGVQNNEGRSSPVTEYFGWTQHQ